MGFEDNLMNFKRLLFLLAALLLLPFSLKVQGQDFGKGQSLYADIKAHQVGDVLTVLIVEQNRASNQVETITEKSTKINASGGPGLGSLGFIPMFGVKADNSNKSKKGSLVLLNSFFKSHPLSPLS